MSFYVHMQNTSITPYQLQTLLHTNELLGTYYTDCPKTISTFEVVSGSLRIEIKQTVLGQKTPTSGL